MSRTQSSLNLSWESFWKINLSNITYTEQSTFVTLIRLLSFQKMISMLKDKIIDYSTTRYSVSDMCL